MFLVQLCKNTFQGYCSFGNWNEKEENEKKRTMHTERIVRLCLYLCRYFLPVKFVRRRKIRATNNERMPGWQVTLHIENAKHKENKKWKIDLMYSMGALVASWSSLFFPIFFLRSFFSEWFSMCRRLLLSFFRFSFRAPTDAFLHTRSISFRYFFDVLCVSSERTIRSFSCIAVVTQSETVANCLGNRYSIIWRSAIEDKKKLKMKQVAINKIVWLFASSILMSIFSTFSHWL